MEERNSEQGPLGSVLPSLREHLRLEQDPLLLELRQRMFLHRLRVLTPISAVIALAQSLLSGPGLWLLLFPATGGAWAWSKRKPVPGWVAAVLMLLFLGCGVQMLALAPAGQLSFIAPLVVLTPIYGTFVGGAVAGGALCLSAAAIIAWALQRLHNADPGSGVVTVAAMLLISSVWYYGAALAQAWIFNSLVKRLRLSHINSVRADSAAQDLAAILAETAQHGVAALRQRLREGSLPETPDLAPFAEELATTRAWLPKSLPRSAVSGTALVEQLQSRAYRAFLGFTLLAALVAGVALYARNEAWPLAAVSAAFLGLSLAAHRFLARWQSTWKLLLGVYAVIVLVDAWFLRAHPPAASLVFLPLMAYTSSFLGLRGLALATFGLGTAAALGACLVPGLQPGMPWVFLALAGAAFTVLQTGRDSMREQAHLLDRLAVEERVLHESLVRYRGLVSTLFHDLANPLSVLQALALLPASLRQAEDHDRAKRMVDRMEGVLKDLDAKAPRYSPSTLSELHQELWDGHSEALRQKRLQWGLGAGAALGLKKAGAPLRDGILGHLLSNAIRFSPPASRIELSAEVRSGGIVLLVRDKGPGLPPEVAADLAQGRLPKPGPDSQGERGLGLGLTLARSRAQSLGGELSFRDLPGGGLEAALWMPA